MTNKELIDKLYEYFLTQDPKVIARMCANLQIDLLRFLRIDKLPDDEAYHLIDRISILREEIDDFIKNGPELDLKLVVTREGNKK